MKSKVEVSVIMSVYNDEKYVAQAINSILNQTFKNFEFIIIDDGSNDDSLKIIKSYDDPRIIVIEQENIGLTKSLNRAIKIAKGKYIARMDSDDISHQERLEKQFRFLESHNKYALVGTNILKIDADSEEIEKNFSKYSNKEIQKTFKSRNCIAHGSVMINRELANNDLIYDESFKYAQDYKLWTKIASQNKVANLEDTLYKLRLHHESISQQKIEEQSIFAAIVAYEFTYKTKIYNIEFELDNNHVLRKKLGIILLMNSQPNIAIKYFRHYSPYFWISKLSNYFDLKKVKNIVKKFR